MLHDRFPNAMAVILWSGMAARSNPDSARGELSADVCVIGGGYTGLSAAHRLQGAWGQSSLRSERKSAQAAATAASSTKFRVSIPSIIKDPHGLAVARHVQSAAKRSIASAASSTKTGSKTPVSR